MPYIKRDRRDDLNTVLTIQPMTVGELNYVITRLVNNYVTRFGPGYDAFNAAVGVLEAAKLELYRRRIAPYEDEKAKTNGDVY